MPFKVTPLKSVRPRREYFRALLILTELAVMVLAIVAKNQPPPVKDGVVYVNREVVFAATIDGTWSQAIMPLYEDCLLHWNDAQGDHESIVESMGTPLDTGAWLPENSQVAFSFRASTMRYEPGHPNMTLYLDDSAVTLWSECPPPAPPPAPKNMAVYVQGNTLLMVDTASGATTPLMPLRSDLLWSGSTSVYLTLDAIPGYMNEPDVAWLPDDAELIGTFTTTTPVEVVTLDSNHLMLRTSTEDIVLLSY